MSERFDPAVHYRVRLRKNSTGEVRVYDHPFPWDEESNGFIWTDGNYGCDCNRANFFAECAGEEYDEDVQCGTGAYSAICAVLPDGREIALDAAVAGANTGEALGVDSATGESLGLVRTADGGPVRAGALMVRVQAIEARAVEEDET